MWLASRIARGPKRAPGRFVTAPSQATPATANGVAAEGAGALRKVSCDKNANEVMGRLVIRAGALYWFQEPRYFTNRDRCFISRNFLMVRRRNFFHALRIGHRIVKNDGNLLI